jgi:hypothetical protein
MPILPGGGRRRERDGQKNTEYIPQIVPYSCTKYLWAKSTDKRATGENIFWISVNLNENLKLLTIKR